MVPWKPSSKLEWYHFSSKQSGAETFGDKGYAVGIPAWTIDGSDPELTVKTKIEHRDYTNLLNFSYKEIGTWNGKKVLELVDAWVGPNTIDGVDIRQSWDSLADKGFYFPIHDETLRLNDDGEYVVTAPPEEEPFTEPRSDNGPEHKVLDENATI